MDPLSDLLSAADVRPGAPSRFEASGQWSLAFEPHEHLKVGAILAGRCVLIPAGGDPLELAAGDGYVLAAGRPYVVASDEKITPVPQQAALPSPWRGTARYGTGGDTAIVVSGTLALDPVAGGLLRDLRPAARRIRDAPNLPAVLDLLGTETATDRPGAGTMRTLATHMLFVEALRALAATGDGWLGALADPSIGRALARIHADPARPWTVAALGAEAHLGRSAFAERFRARVGLSPIEYVTRWRMLIAARSLRSTDRTVAAVALDLGYRSEGAFSAAFRRVFRTTPSNYRRPGSASPPER